MSNKRTNTSQRVTLREIAEQANVSVSTVSRALNNNPNVNEETRQHVHEVVKQLAYPLEHLRSGRQTQQKSILLLARGDFAQNTSEFSFGADFEKLVTLGVRKVLEDTDIEVSLRYILMRDEDAAPFVNSFDADGAVLLTGMVAPEFARALQDADIPFVIAGAHVFPLQTNCVMADNVRGVEMAVDHLVARGRRTIALVNSSTLTKTSEDKLRGLRLGLHMHGLPYSPDQVVWSEDFDLESGYAQTRQLFKQRPDVDAVIYGHDVMAMGGLRALKEMGHRVPDDIAVVGFHDYEIAQFTDPPLTSIRFDTELMGMMVAKRLRMLLDEPDDQSWFLVLPVELVVRDST